MDAYKSIFIQNRIKQKDKQKEVRTNFKNTKKRKDSQNILY